MFESACRSKKLWSEGHMKRARRFSDVILISRNNRELAAESVPITSEDGLNRIRGTYRTFLG